MKKNLRIASVAAAALLAVAPVAASAVQPTNTVLADGDNSGSSETNAISFDGLNGNTVYVNKNSNVSEVTTQYKNKIANDFANKLNMTVTGNDIRVDTSITKDGTPFNDNTFSDVTTDTNGKYEETTTIDISGIPAKYIGLVFANGSSSTASVTPSSGSSTGTLHLTFTRRIVVADKSASATPAFAFKNPDSSSSTFDPVSNNSVIPYNFEVDTNNGSVKISALRDAINNLFSGVPAAGATPAVPQQLEFYNNLDPNNTNNSWKARTFKVNDDDVINGLKANNINVSGSGDNATFSEPSNGFLVDIKGTSWRNGTSTATVKAAFNGAAVTSDVPAFKLGSDDLDDGHYFVTQQSDTSQAFDPLKPDGTSTISAVQAAGSDVNATITSKSDVNLRKTGTYKVTLTAKNVSGKTKSITYYLIVTNNHSQAVHPEGDSTTIPTYDIVGNSAIKKNATLNNGDKVYVGEYSKTIGKDTYVRVSTDSMRDANNPNSTTAVWIKTSALANNGNNNNNNTQNETSTSKTVMFKSVKYDKDGNRISGASAIGGYTDVDLATKNGKLVVVNNSKGSFYKIANKDQYIRTRNVTGSHATLRHNAYVYKSNGRKARKHVLRKGTKITVYGGSYRAIRHYRGKAYRIGTNRYVKVGNVRHFKLA